jgi:hypothetical protein
MEGKMEHENIVDEAVIVLSMLAAEREMDAWELSVMDAEVELLKFKLERA